MIKRTVCLLLAVLLCFGAAGCKKKTKKKTKKAASSSASSEVVETVAINPLTGVKDLDPALLDRRPAAIMINNINFAQDVQTGLCKADVVYETEVEGGITRLMAVFKNIAAVPELGGVRSARYVYVDLASGHDAIYLHHGQDDVYCGPHLNDIDRLVVAREGNGHTVQNGLAIEHTLYGYGDKIWEQLTQKFRVTTTKTTPWLTFTKEKESVTLTGGTANVVTVPFSFPAIFTYEAESGKYVRSNKNGVLLDYMTKEPEKFKNIFILNTTIDFYPGNYRRNVALDSGTGMYAVNGTFQQINWKKGEQNDQFVFTNTDGSPLKVNAGNSWIFIVNSSTTVPTFQ